MTSQDPGAQRVEGAHGHLPAGLPDEPQDALAHLVGGLVGERDRQDLPRPHALDAHQVGDPMGEHARLARPGTGQDEQRPVRGGDRACLLRVETADDARRQRLRPDHPPVAPPPAAPGPPCRRSPRPRTRLPPRHPRAVRGAGPACGLALARPLGSAGGQPTRRRGPRRSPSGSGSGGGGSSGQSKQS